MLFRSSFFEGKFSTLEGKIADKFSILEGKIDEKFSIIERKLDINVEQKIYNVATHEDERKNDKLVSEKGKDNDNFDVLLDVVEGQIFYAEGNEEEEIRATATTGKQFDGQNKENKQDELLIKVEEKDVSVTYEEEKKKDCSEVGVASVSSSTESDNTFLEKVDNIVKTIVQKEVNFLLFLLCLFFVSSLHNKG